MSFLSVTVEIKTKEIADAVGYILVDKLENMQSQLGYVRTLDTDTIWVWSGGSKQEVNRMDWIDLTEAEIAKCKAHIVAMADVKE